MKQIQKELFAGASYAEQFANDYRIRIPNEIKNPSDAKFVPVTHDSRAGDKAIIRASEIINKFYDITDKVIKEYKKNPNVLQDLNLKKLVLNFVQGHNSTEQLIKVYESVLSNGAINPITYIYAKEHFIIANIFLSKFREIDIESIKNKKLELNDSTKENFRLGIFIGLEPILVTAIFSALKRDDSILSQNYGKLVEQYARIVVKMYPDEYIKATKINKPILSADKYLKLLSVIEAERNGQVLL